MILRFCIVSDVRKHRAIVVGERFVPSPRAISNFKQNGKLDARVEEVVRDFTKQWFKSVDLALFAHQWAKAQSPEIRPSNMTWELVELITPSGLSFEKEREFDQSLRKMVEYAWAGVFPEGEGLYPPGGPHLVSCAGL